MVTYEEIRKDEGIRTYIAEADASLLALGYTEHSFAHVTHVAETAIYWKRWDIRSRRRSWRGLRVICMI